MTSKGIRHPGKTAAGQLGHLSAGLHHRLHDGCVQRGGVTTQKHAKGANILSSLDILFLDQKKSSNSATHRKHNSLPLRWHPAQEWREHLSALMSGFEKCQLSRSSFYLRISTSVAPAHLTELQKYEVIEAFFLKNNGKIFNSILNLVDWKLQTHLWHRST